MVHDAIDCLLRVCSTPQNECFFCAGWRILAFSAVIVQRAKTMSVFAHYLLVLMSQCMIVIHSFVLSTQRDSTCFRQSVFCSVVAGEIASAVAASGAATTGGELVDPVITIAIGA